MQYSSNIKRAWKHPTSIETVCFSNILLQGESHLENDATWIVICAPAFRRSVLPPISDYGGSGFFGNVGTRVPVSTTSHRRCYCQHSEKITTHIYVLGFSFLWPCIVSKVWRQRKTNKMQQSNVYYQLLSQHVSGIIMPICSRSKTVLLHVVYCSGSAGCGW